MDFEEHQHAIDDLETRAVAEIGKDEHTAIAIYRVGIVLAQTLWDIVYEMRRS